MRLDLYANSDKVNVLALIGLKEEDVERFRGAGIEDGKIIIHTRTGGGNREDYPNKKLTENKYYLSDRDDDFDSTYADYFFSIPAEPRKFVTVNMVKEFEDFILTCHYKYSDDDTPNLYGVSQDFLDDQFRKFFLSALDRISKEAEERANEKAFDFIGNGKCTCPGKQFKHDLNCPAVIAFAQKQATSAALNRALEAVEHLSDSNEGKPMEYADVVEAIASLKEPKK